MEGEQIFSPTKKKHVIFLLMQIILATFLCFLCQYINVSFRLVIVYYGQVYHYNYQIMILFSDLTFLEFYSFSSPRNKPSVFCSAGGSLADTDSLVRMKAFHCFSMLQYDKIMFAEGTGVKTNVKTCIPEVCDWVLGSDSCSCYWLFCFPHSLQKIYGKYADHATSVSFPFLPIS